MVSDLKDQGLISNSVGTFQLQSLLQLSAPVEISASCAQVLLRLESQQLSLFKSSWLHPHNIKLSRNWSIPSNMRSYFNNQSSMHQFFVFLQKIWTTSAILAILFNSVWLRSSSIPCDLLAKIHSKITSRIISTLQQINAFVPGSVFLFLVIFSIILVFDSLYCLPMIWMLFCCGCLLDCLYFMLNSFVMLSFCWDAEMSSARL